MGCSNQKATHLANLKKMYAAMADAILKLDSKLVREYTIADRTFQYQNLPEMHKTLESLNGKICSFESGSGIRSQTVIPTNKS